MASSKWWMRVGAWVLAALAWPHGQAQPASGGSAVVREVAPAVVAPLVPEQVAQAYRYGDFVELSRLYARYGAPGVRSPQTGNERVTHFWDGIDEVGGAAQPVTEGFYQQQDALTRRWTEEHPQSALAHLLYLKSLFNHAWFVRGSGFANTVSPAAQAAFRKYRTQALAHLDRHEALLAKDSSADLFRLEIGRDLGWPIERLMQVFVQGIAKNPDHDNLYFWMQFAMLPRWGGDLDMIERFIATVTQTTRATRGLEMYARLYASLSYLDVKLSLFSVTRASWPSMKAGFEDRLSRYPHTDHHNMYAYFACMAEDREALREQLRLMKGTFTPIFWGDRPERRFEECEALAQQF